MPSFAEWKEKRRRDQAKIVAPRLRAPIIAHCTSSAAQTKVKRVAPKPYVEAKLSVQQHPKPKPLSEGCYDEVANASAFKAAVQEWRSGIDPAPRNMLQRHAARRYKPLVTKGNNILVARPYHTQDEHEHHGKVMYASNHKGEKSYSLLEATKTTPTPAYLGGQGYDEAANAVDFANAVSDWRKSRGKVKIVRE